MDMERDASALRGQNLDEASRLVADLNGLPDKAVKVLARQLNMSDEDPVLALRVNPQRVGIYDQVAADEVLDAITAFQKTSTSTPRFGRGLSLDVPLSSFAGHLQMPRRRLADFTGRVWTEPCCRRCDRRCRCSRCRCNSDGDLRHHPQAGGPGGRRVALSLFLFLVVLPQLKVLLLSDRNCGDYRKLFTRPT
jgi:hypothetical protein